MHDALPDLTDEERDALIERIATEVVRRGMVTPAVLFLEMHKPVSFLAGQGLIVMSPFVAPFVGIDAVYRGSALLQERANVERLICRIEQLAEEPMPDTGRTTDAAR